MEEESEAQWKAGFGVLRRQPETLDRIHRLAERLVEQGVTPCRGSVFRILGAADRLTRAGMWMVAHMSYARRVDLSGQALPAEAFKPEPEGHMGGSLNMVPAFVGYLAANALSGKTRSWVMGQGHCVAAIEAVNALTGDVSAAQQGRYDGSEAGLSRLAADFYDYAIAPDGRPGAPLGSHAGPYTAGALSEGGYLGFAELQYVHMPLPGESLVAFLSDGAFEEQRGSDWAPRWWRAEDSGWVSPVMILNGRRIEERTQIEQQGGERWLEAHLRLSGFDPFIIDGHDPAAFAWAILECEARLHHFAQQEPRSYPAPLPYVIARAVKGFGFPGAGTNPAHNLPLAGNPATEEAARRAFNEAATALFVPPAELEAAVSALATHEAQARPLESAHPIARRQPPTPKQPPPTWSADAVSPMEALDRWFVALVGANPELRVRVGNPDELRSNRMGATLDALRHRVSRPEPTIAEAVDGAVITALNEEAVAGAALGNKGGLNLIVSYEAFAVKMLGGLRQEIIFARRQKEIGAPPRWLAIPLIATSHTWENSKNEQSHQDPTLAEALLGEMSDTARVLFPIDANSAVAALADVYRGRGQLACLVVPKRRMPTLLDGERSTDLTKNGAVLLAGDLGRAEVQLVAIGAYQAGEALKAHARLELAGVPCAVSAILEPGRFREPRDDLEAAISVSAAELEQHFPAGLPRLFLTHTRPEPMLGLLRRMDGGPRSTRALGYIGHGGTFDVFGMLFANRCTWAHAAAGAAELLGRLPGNVLDNAELDALRGTGEPRRLEQAAT